MPEVSPDSNPSKDDDSPTPLGLPSWRQMGALVRFLFMLLGAGAIVWSWLYAAYRGGWVAVLVVILLLIVVAFSVWKGE